MNTLDQKSWFTDSADEENFAQKFHYFNSWKHIVAIIWHLNLRIISIFSNKRNICPSNLAPSQCLLIIGLICSVYHHQLLCTLFWSTKPFITKYCYAVDRLDGDVVMSVTSFESRLFWMYIYMLPHSILLCQLLTSLTFAHRPTTLCHIVIIFSIAKTLPASESPKFNQFIIIFSWFPLIFICTSATTNITINHMRSQTPLSHPYCYQVFS